jgi:hypothetical protein
MLPQESSDTSMHSKAPPLKFVTRKASLIKDDASIDFIKQGVVILEICTVPIFGVNEVWIGTCIKM